MIKHISTIVVAAFLAVGAGQAFAQDKAADCTKQAAEKKLAGAAKNSFIKKCEKDAGAATASASCEPKAVDKNGKPLAGAAKTSFMKKCSKDAAPAK